MDKKNILLVEDDNNIRNIVKFNLEKENYKVFEACTGEEALSIAENNDLNLILMDIMMPTMDGYESTKRIREFSDVPIIMLTALEGETNKLDGFELGADDYITKPFSMRELMARVKVHTARIDAIRSVQKNSSNLTTSTTNKKFINIVDIKDIRLNTETHTISKGENQISLSDREYNLLIFLYENAGHVFDREYLLENVWGYSYGDLRTIDVTVKRLREKIEDNSSDPKIIKTRRGRGYYLSLNQNVV